MKSDWRTSTWGEEISLEYGKATRGYSTIGGAYRVFGTNGPIGWTLEALAPGPGIILGRKGAYRGVHYSKEPFWVIDTAYYVQSKLDHDMRWLFYAIQHYKLGEIDDGSPIPSTTKSAVYVKKVKVPPLGEQQRVAHILGTLDDKIELNRRMAATLEEMARAIFKSWFIDFDPVHIKSQGRPTNLPPEIDALFPDSFGDSGLGAIPHGWRIGSVSEIADIGGGSTPSTKSPEFWDGEHAWATPKDLSKLSHPVLLQTERRITDAGLRSISSGLYPAGTVLMSSRAPIGYLAISEIPVAVNQGFIALRPKIENGSVFLLKWLETHMDEVHGRSNGSTFMEISKSAFRAIDTVLPPSSLIEAFGRLVQPMYVRLVGVVTESETLGCVRDTLLPKLISGEIEVPLSAIPD